MNKLFFSLLMGVIVSVAFASGKEMNKNSDLINALPQPYAAPDFVGIQAWLNSAPLTIEQLKGKVVLVDFWTYSCINCVHTLPHMTGLDEKYRDKGLVIVGVHSPEFEFEKNVDNIKAAIEKNHIQYPVAVDSNMSTWTRYRNQYWPAQYLINKDGEVVYTHIGERDDDILDHNIRVLLGLSGPMPIKAGLEPVFHFSQTPETYLGSLRSARFVGIEKSPGLYQYPASIGSNEWALQGPWIIESEKIISNAARASLKLSFNAQKVFLVMGTSTDEPIQVTLRLNNEPITTLMVKRHTLYELINQQDFQNGLLEIEAGQPGLELYAFTFE